MKHLNIMLTNIIVNIIIFIFKQMHFP